MIKQHWKSHRSEAEITQQYNHQRSNLTMRQALSLWNKKKQHSTLNRNHATEAQPNNNTINIPKQHNAITQFLYQTQQTIILIFKKRTVFFCQDEKFATIYSIVYQNVIVANVNTLCFNDLYIIFCFKQYNYTAIFISIQPILFNIYSKL